MLLFATLTSSSRAAQAGPSLLVAGPDQPIWPRHSPVPPNRQQKIPSPITLMPDTDTETPEVDPAADFPLIGLAVTTGSLDKAGSGLDEVSPIVDPALQMRGTM